MVLHDDGLSELASQRFAQHARQNVCRAARRKTDDQAHRFVGVALRQRACRGHEAREAADKHAA